jgi:phosphoserine phosphatase RsbU/P
MESNTLKKKYDIKELELNSLLEITQAINNNMSENSLYKIFNFTLRSNLNIKKLALYVLDDEWECKVNFGTKNNFEEIPLDYRFQQVTNIQLITDIYTEGEFHEFDKAMPVTHKDRLLAVVLVAGDGNLTPDQGINFTLIQALSNIIIVAIENKKLARRQLRQEALRKELEIAKNVQSFLFPKNLPYTDDLQVQAKYLPHHNVGGDYYDFIEISEDKFFICIADVSGKGVPAAILMSNFQASLHTLIRKSTNLKEIVEELNHQIIKNANGENFITYFGAIYDKKQAEMQYVNAGHNPPVLISENKLETLQEGTTILGTFEPLPFLNHGTVSNLQRFFFFGYTDGVTETFNPAGEEFGNEKLEQFLHDAYVQDLPTIHQNLLDKLESFRGGEENQDDITFISCKVN